MATGTVGERSSGKKRGSRGNGKNGKANGDVNGETSVYALLSGRTMKMPKGVEVLDMPVYNIPTELIEPNPEQPRDYFDPELMRNLTIGIGEVGQHMPGFVRVEKKGVTEYELIDGERRFRACMTLGIPFKAFVTDLSRDEADILAVTINFNRQDHDAVETARSILKLLKNGRVTKLPKSQRLEAVAKMYGRSEAWAKTYKNLLNMPVQLQERMRDKTPKGERIPVVIASRICNLPHEEQFELIEGIKKRGLRGRHARAYIDRELNLRGFAEHRRGKNPSDEWRLYRNAVARWGNDLADFLNDPGAFGKLLDSRNVLEQQVLRDELGSIIDYLQEMRQMVYERCGKLVG